MIQPLQPLATKKEARNKRRSVPTSDEDSKDNHSHSKDCKRQCRVSPVDVSQKSSTVFGSDNNEGNSTKACVLISDESKDLEVMRDPTETFLADLRANDFKGSRSKNETFQGLRGVDGANSGSKNPSSYKPVCKRGSKSMRGETEHASVRAAVMGLGYTKGEIRMVAGERERVRVWLVRSNDNRAKPQIKGFLTGIGCGHWYDND